MANETPSQQVFHNSLLIDNVYGWLDKKADIINCAVTCKEGLPAAARALCKEVPRDLPKMLLDVDCPFVSRESLPGTTIRIAERC